MESGVIKWQAVLKSEAGEEGLHTEIKPHLLRFTDIDEHLLPFVSLGFQTKS